LTSSTLWNFEGGSGVERVRLPVLNHLSKAGVALCDSLLLRGCARHAEHWPGFITDLFGVGCLDDTTCVHNKRLGFSLGEPAVNVYQEGGCFKPHQDQQVRETPSWPRSWANFSLF
jgi:hypothetical protein